MVKRIKEIRDNASRRVSDILADIQSRLRRKSRELPLSDRTIGQWLEKWAANVRTERPWFILTVT